DRRRGSGPLGLQLLAQNLHPAAQLVDLLLQICAARPTTGLTLRQAIAVHDEEKAEGPAGGCGHPGFSLGEAGWRASSRARRLCSGGRPRRWNTGERGWALATPHP